MKIFYVHHAMRDKGNPPSQDDGLTTLGVKDATLMGELFLEGQNKGLNIKAIYTSPFKRCLQTAELIAKHLNVPIISEPRFNEFGSVFYAVKNQVDPNQKETWLDCQNRIIKALEDIVSTHNNEDTILCVTSGVNLAAFIAFAFNISPSETLPFPQVPSCSPIGFDINK